MKKSVIYIITFLSFLFIAGALYYWFFKSAIPPLDKNTFSIGNNSFTVEVADTLRSRAQGLSGRASLGEHDGMLFVFPIPAKYPFWMKDMNFPLDIIWIRNNAIIGYSENVPPPPNSGMLDLPTYSPPGTIDSALELPAGSVKKFAIKAGDSVILKK